MFKIVVIEKVSDHWSAGMLGLWDARSRTVSVKEGAEPAGASASHHLWLSKKDVAGMCSRQHKSDGQFVSARARARVDIYIYIYIIQKPAYVANERHTEYTYKLGGITHAVRHCEIEDAVKVLDATEPHGGVRRDVRAFWYRPWLCLRYHESSESSTSA